MHTFLLAAATVLTVAPLERSAMPVARAEAMQRFLAANPGWHQATRAELRSMGVPDSVNSVAKQAWSTTKTCTGLWTTWWRVTTTGASGAA